MKQKSPKWLIPLLTRHLTMDYGDFIKIKDNFNNYLEDNPVSERYGTTVWYCSHKLDNIVDTATYDFSKAKDLLNDLISWIKGLHQELRL